MHRLFGQNCADGIWVDSEGPEGHPYRGLKTALNYYGGMLGARSVTWHQGEEDAEIGISQATYAFKLDTLITRSRLDFNGNLGWAISRVSRFGPFNADPNLDKVKPTIRAAQEQVKILKLLRNGELIFLMI